MKYLRNRYNDLFSFTINDSGDVLWEGNFEYCRIGWPNKYEKAHDAYLRDGGQMGIDWFKGAMSNSESEEFKKYCSMLETDTSKICMVDPSGGPFMHEGHSLKMLGEEFDGKVIDRFEEIETGYKIIIKKWNS